MPPSADRLDAPARAAPADGAGAAAAGPGPYPVPHDEPSDEALMTRYARGDVAAFERLYGRHEGPVYRFLLRSVGIPALADELLQEVWMSVIRGSAAYEPRALFTTWLYRIARTRLIDHWRARDPALLVSLDAAADGAGDDATAASAVDRLAADTSYEPETRALDRAQARAFTLAVEALPVAQREAFLLHAQAGLSLAQIAGITGAGVETIKSRLRYAGDKLRLAMQNWREPR